MIACHTVTVTTTAALLAVLRRYRGQTVCLPYVRYLARGQRARVTVWVEEPSTQQMKETP